MADKGNGEPIKDNFGNTGKQIDYVLFYQNPNFEDIGTEEVSLGMERRDAFESTLKKDGLEVEHEVIGENVYVKVHCPFERLCIEAEKVKLEMPLSGLSIPKHDSVGWWDRFQNALETDDEVDFISAPFQIEKKWLYEGITNKSTFFRPALRHLLAHHILINLDIRKSDKIEGEEQTINKQGLPFLLMTEAYNDAFVLHDPSKLDPFRTIKDMTEINNDARRVLNNTWLSFLQFQPLWKIRHYFGEKIALYFAWQGLLITSLWVPSLFGIGFFVYGLLSTDKMISHYNGTRFVDQVHHVTDDTLEIIRKALDNNATPYYALIISLWGTLFVEFWKRKNAMLAYEWDVDNFEETEPDRPQFYGTEVELDPVTKENTWYYPFRMRLLKHLTSMSILLLMICLVFASVIGVIVFRVVAVVDWGHTAETKFIYSSIIAAFLNFISILILGFFYEKIAKILTDWENHRTQSEYNDALIIKLFAFQFVNSYASLFYISFFKGNLGKNGIFGLGPSYVERCDVTGCMSTLSFQVLVMMALKPMCRNSFTTLQQYIKLKIRLGHIFTGNKVGASRGTKEEIENYMARERLKDDLGDFTLGETTEKIIQYGYVMLFAASFPLAPLLALLTNAFDLRMDARRLLWWSRRPVAFIAQDLGMWLDILQFVNIAGVITNGFLIAFTSSFGRNYSESKQLWIVIIFEHIVLIVMAFLQFLIPDVPAQVNLARRRERFQVAKILEEGIRNYMKTTGEEINVESGSPVNKIIPDSKSDNQNH